MSFAINWGIALDVPTEEHCAIQKSFSKLALLSKFETTIPFYSKGGMRGFLLSIILLNVGQILVGQRLDSAAGDGGYS